MFKSFVVDILDRARGGGGESEPCRPGQPGPPQEGEHHQLHGSQVRNIFYVKLNDEKLIFDG